MSFATENQALVKEVYHYLKAEGFSVFFAPSSEGQALISGKNEHEIFYQIFGCETKYAALFVSRNYIMKEVPMEEARISIAKHSWDGSVIPIYLDDAKLPPDLLDPKQTNYFRSHSAAEIAAHLTAKLKRVPLVSRSTTHSGKEMNISGNHADKQVFIQNMNGTIEL